MPIPFILPTVKPSVIKLQRDLAYFFPELTHFYGYAGTPDHNTKRCLDAMVYDSSGKYVAQQGRSNLPYSERIKLGDRVAGFLIKNAEHYHLNGIIWNRHVMGFPGGSAGQTGNYRGPFGEWRNYTLTAHDDHIHIDQDGRDFESLIPDVPFEWDGASFPGAQRFGDGQSGPWITYLGQRLVAHGWTGYKVGPGPEWGAADQAAVKWFQEKQGWTGSDADGIPGPQTWALLTAEPVVQPPAPPKPAAPEKPANTRPEEPKPEEPKPVTKPGPITLRLKAWDGSPAGRTFIQGVLWDSVNDCYFVHQADDVAGQAEQNVVIRRHKSDGTYVGWATIPNAGHGSSIGLDPFKGGARLWLGHAKLGAGHMAYNIGSDDTPFTKVPRIPKGDISIDTAADLLVVRNGTHYRGYRLGDARKNKATKVFDIRIANWMTRFQGHLVAGDRLYIHRDVKTKGASELRCYDFKGKLLRKWDTSGWGDEAEGAMVKDGWVFSVSRVGGNNPDRTIVCTPIEEY